MGHMVTLRVCDEFASRITSIKLFIPDSPTSHLNFIRLAFVTPLVHIKTLIRSAQPSHMSAA